MSFSRVFLTVIGCACFAAAVPVVSSASAEKQPFVLSKEGSGRASAYDPSSKIVTLGNKTHVAWLDADASGFKVRMRTLDRTTGEWTPIIEIGDAMDNHGGPGLTVDSEGYLHIVYYPHHRPFRYRKSLRPNDASAWGPEIQFGESLSYPVLLCAPDNTLILTARRYYEGNDKLNELELWKKPANGDWHREGVIIRSRYLGYVNFAESLAWSPDHRTIHLSCRVYETNPSKEGEPIQTLGYLKSSDFGKTWTKADGTAVALPATADTIDQVTAERFSAKKIKADAPVELEANGVPRPNNWASTVNSGAIAVGADGTPYLLHTEAGHGVVRTYLATPAASGTWSRRDLQDTLPAAWKDHEIGMPGAVTVSKSGRITIVATLGKPAPGQANWALPDNRIVRIWSDDGAKTFKSEVLTPASSGRPQWLPNIERATGHHEIPDEPGIIYTVGDSGGGLKDLELKNEVWWKPAN